MDKDKKCKDFNPLSFLESALAGLCNCSSGADNKKEDTKTNRSTRIDHRWINKYPDDPFEQQ